VQQSSSASYPEGTILGLRPGEIIDGRFRVDGLIGYGGQGVVLRVTHLEWDRELAMKLPLPEVVGSPSKRERFLNEAETWIRLGVHPHIVRCWFVHKVVGLPALFLDLIPGGSLEDRMKSKKLAPGDWNGILHSLLQVVEGLSHSHSMGVVHRDIKPENLLLKQDGTVCVTDFGLVKSIDSPDIESGADEIDEPGKDPGLTGSAQFLGTPRYGAPEQWNKDMTIGPTTDIYAVGVILYEMLAGRRPFDAPGETLDVLELIHRHLGQEPADPRQFNPEIPESLAQLALHCLQKIPEQRPQSMLALMKMLATIFRELCAQDYKRPQPVPGGDRADLLNNAAYSLYALGRVEKARSLLQRGLVLEAGHPECLYNLIQLDRREGRIGPAEGLRKLQRANARYQLALLFIEEGMGKQAMDLLNAFPEEEKHGLVYRTQGDAQMYDKQYLAAQRFYEKAQLSMPNDQPTRLRKLLAMQGARGLEGHVFFPSSVSCYANKAPNPELALLLSHDSQWLLGVNSREVVCLDIETETPIALQDRPEGATPVVRTWTGEHRLLVQDRGAFELWDLEELHLLQRKEGRVLTASPDLKKLVLLQRDGVAFLNKTDKIAGLLTFPPGTEPSGNVRACFTPDGSGLCILTPSGQVGQVDTQLQVIPLPWPPQLPHFDSVLSLGLSPTGVLYSIHHNCLFQANDFSSQKTLFSMHLPFQPERLYLDRSGQTIVVSSVQRFGVFSPNGEILFRGKGPFAVDATRRYGIGWTHGTLTLFELSPFRRVRSWAQKIPVPCSIHIGKDGRRAASLLSDGSHQVWEVDEDNRVYERNLLLTPGQSYSELIKGYAHFQQAFAAAKASYDKGHFFHSCQILKKARSFKGFFQAKEALELHRELSTKLRRGGLEAIWERLNLIDTTSAKLCSASHIAFSQGQRWTILNYRGPDPEEIASGQMAAAILGVHRLATANATFLFVYDREGNLLKLDAESGSELGRYKLGPSQDVRFFQEYMYVAGGGGLKLWDLSEAKMEGSVSLPPAPTRELFGLAEGRVVVNSPQGAEVYNLRASKSEGVLKVKLPQEPSGGVTYVNESEDRRVLYIGYADGTFAIADPRSGKVYFAQNYQCGPVTGIALNMKVAFGIVISSSGKLVVFDLTNGNIIERITAHPGAIAHLQVTDDGRYLITRTQTGGFRLWELSWALTDSTKPLSIDWLPKGILNKLGSLLFKPL
jgi:serine/threonine protein kinase/WD40 repeat protein